MTTSYAFLQIAMTNGSSALPIETDSWRRRAGGRNAFRLHHKAQAMTYYKYTFMVTLVTEQKIDPFAITLKQIVDAMVDGEDSGQWEISREEQLTPRQAALALVAQDARCQIG